MARKKKFGKVTPRSVFKQAPTAKSLIKELRSDLRSSGVKNPNALAKRIGQMFMINAAAAAPRTGKGHTFG